jgi:hypothetical protein
MIIDHIADAEPDRLDNGFRFGLVALEATKLFAARDLFFVGAGLRFTGRFKMNELTNAVSPLRTSALLTTRTPEIVASLRFFF